MLVLFSSCTNKRRIGHFEFRTLNRDSKKDKRTILHCDLNGFYVSVECLYQPELENVPMAVGGNVENRHGIILAKTRLREGGLMCGAVQVTIRDPQFRTITRQRQLSQPTRLINEIVEAAIKY